MAFFRHVQEKVENAQAAGFMGAIVFNYNDDELIPMGRFSYSKVGNIVNLFEWKPKTRVIRQSLFLFPSFQFVTFEYTFKHCYVFVTLNFGYF